jgi:hypothetical protein
VEKILEEKGKKFLGIILTTIFGDQYLKIRKEQK